MNPSIDVHGDMRLTLLCNQPIKVPIELFAVLADGLMEARKVACMFGGRILDRGGSGTANRQSAGEQEDCE
jgi:hypothetical protein